MGPFSGPPALLRAIGGMWVPVSLVSGAGVAAWNHPRRRSLPGMGGKRRPTMGNASLNPAQTAGGRGPFVRVQGGERLPPGHSDIFRARADGGYPSGC